MPTLPEIEEPDVPTLPENVFAVTPPTEPAQETFQSLEELQDVASDFAFAIQTGEFAADILTVAEAPVGRASYDGLILLERVSSIGVSQDVGGVSGQLNMTVDFGSPDGNNITGLARSFVYLPEGGDVFVNTDGARPVLGSLTITGDVDTSSANPNSLVVASVATSGSVQIPEDIDDLDPSFVSVRGTHATEFAGNVVGFTGITRPLAGDTFVQVSGIGWR